MSQRSSFKERHFALPVQILCLLCFFVVSATQAACKPTHTPIERSQIRSTEEVLSIPQSPLIQPSDSMRDACSRSKNPTDCARLPWNLDLYNEIARLVDSAGLGCSHLFVRAGQSATLRSQPSAAAPPVITLFSGTELLAPALGTQKVEFVQVRYRDNLGMSYGNTSTGEPAAFVERASTTCEIPSQKPVHTTTLGTQEARPGDNGIQRNPSIAAPALGETLSSPSRPEKMRCMAIVPAHAKLLIWATPKCRGEDGASQDLARGAMVEVGIRPEPGTPASYWEINRECRILAENLDLGKCQPVAN